MSNIELDDFQKILLKKATEIPKEGLKIMRKFGKEAKKYAVKKGKVEVKKRTGNYHKSWKVGKAFKQGEEYKIYVKNLSPHAHLIEDGHRNVDKTGVEHGFTKGKHVLEDSVKEFEENHLEELLEDWLDDFLDRGW